jgi:hypothetical protein
LKTYSITFLPDEKTIKAAAGKTILEAAAVEMECVASVV